MKSSILVSVMAVVAGTTAAMAQSDTPVTPVYTRTVSDAVTGDNAFVAGGFRYWTVDAGADRYQTDLYERPIAASMGLVGTRYAAEEYAGYVDITQAKWGVDDRFVYVSIDLFNLQKQTKDGVNTVVGLQGRYGVRLSNNRDGRFGILLVATQPQAATTTPTVFTPLKTEGWRDIDGDVGGRGGPLHGRPGPTGLAVTKTDNPREEFGLNGYEAEFVGSDGQLGGSGPVVLWQRVSPTDPTVVEIAFNYLASGFTRAQMESLASVEFEAIAGSPSDPQGYLWNDKFTASEAGSPNPGVGGMSEFGTQGLTGISMVDTLRGIAPEPCSPDCNQDGVLNASDFTCFQNAFAIGDLSRADCSGDGRLDVMDFVCFQNAFALGCR